MVTLRRLGSNVCGSVAIALLSVLVFGGVLMLIDGMVVSGDPSLAYYSPEEIEYIASEDFLKNNESIGWVTRLVMHEKAKAGTLNSLGGSGWLGFFTLDMRILEGLDWLGVAIRTIYSSCVFVLTALFIAEILPFYVDYK